MTWQSMFLQGCADGLRGLTRFPVAVRDGVIVIQVGPELEHRILHLALEPGWAVLTGFRGTERRVPLVDGEPDIEALKAATSEVCDDANELLVVLRSLS